MLPFVAALALTLAPSARADELPSETPQTELPAEVPRDDLGIPWRSTDPASGFPVEAWDWVEKSYPQKAQIWALLSEGRKKELLGLALDALKAQAREARSKAEESGAEAGDKAGKAVDDARSKYGDDAVKAGAELDGASVRREAVSGSETGVELAPDEGGGAVDGPVPPAVPKGELDDKAPPDLSKRSEAMPEGVPQENLNHLAIDLAMRRVKTPMFPGVPFDPRVVPTAAEQIVDQMSGSYAVKPEDTRVNLGLAKVAVTGAKDDKMAFRVDFARFLPFEMAGNVTFNKEGAPSFSTSGKMVKSEADRLENRLKSWVGMKTAPADGSRPDAGGATGGTKDGSGAKPDESFKLGFSPKVSPSLHPYMGGRLTADAYGGRLFAEGGGRFGLKGGGPSPQLKAGVQAGAMRFEARTEGVMAFDRTTLEGRYGEGRAQLSAVYDPTSGRTGGGAQYKFDQGIRLGARIERTQRDTSGMVTLEMTTATFENVVGSLF